MKILTWSTALHSSCQLRYLGKRKNEILSRAIQHQEDNLKEKWESSGATEHTLDGNFNWLHAKISVRETYNRKKNKGSSRY